MCSPQHEPACLYVAPFLFEAVLQMRQENSRRPNEVRMKLNEGQTKLSTQCQNLALKNILKYTRDLKLSCCFSTLAKKSHQSLEGLAVCLQRILGLGKFPDVGREFHSHGAATRCTAFI